MPFDYAGAKRAGYSDAEIADYLSAGAMFDAASARKAGYDDNEIVQHLQAREAERAARDSSRPSGPAAPIASAAEADRIVKGAFGNTPAPAPVSTTVSRAAVMRPDQSISTAVTQFQRDEAPGGRGGISSIRPQEMQGEQIEIAKPPVPEDTWAQTGQKMAQRAIPGFQSALGGAMQGIIETATNPGASIPVVGMALQRLPAFAEAQQRAIDNIFPTGVPGSEMAKRAREELEKNGYQPGESQAKYYIGLLGDSLIQMAPAIAATIATRNPSVGTGIMGAQVAGQQYGESRGDRNRSIDESQRDAVYMGVTEILGEKIPLGRILEPAGGKLLTEVLKTAGLEAGQEMVTQALQTGYQAGVLKDDMTLGQALKSVMDAGIVGAGMGASMQAASAPFNRRIGTRPIPVGEVEAASALTDDDRASPLPDALIARGKAVVNGVEGAARADAVLQAAGLPNSKSAVSVDLGDGQSRRGVIEDAFERDGESGVKIRLEDGSLFEEFLSDIADAGVKITPAQQTAAEINTAMSQEADAARARAVEAIAGMEAAPPAVAPQVIAEPTPPATTTAVNSDAITGFMAKTRRAESSGDDNAKNSRSSATGRYQFTNGTWLRTYRQEFGDTGETSEQILAKRGDGAMQDRLMRRLTNDNAAALRQGGHDVTEGNLYLAHFAGSGGANALLSADPNAPVESVLGRGAVEANPFLRGKTASDVIAWAASKMGGKAQVVGGGAPTPSPDQPYVDPYQQAMEGYQAWENAQQAAPADAPIAPIPLPEPFPAQSEQSETSGAPASSPLLGAADGARPVDGGQPVASSEIRGEPIDKEWTAFRSDSGTLAIPRDEMPQIKAENRGAMVNFLNARGIAHEERTVPAESLKPTQAEFSEAKVEKARNFAGGNRAILVSNDGYVVDGHHQWMAARDAGEDVRTIRLDAPIAELINTVREMPSVETAKGEDVPVVAAPSKLRQLIDARKVGQTAPALSQAEQPPSAAGVEPAEIAAAGPEAATPPAASTPAASNPQTAPTDMLKFIARAGGLSYDGLNEQSRKEGAKGHDLRNSGSLQAFIPGAGPLLRPGGLSLDQMGERLWDAGYFGPPDITPRPTDGEIIQVLDDVLRRKEKRYSSFDQAPEAARAPLRTAADDNMAETEAQATQYMAVRDAWDTAAARLGLPPMFQSEIDRARWAPVGGENIAPLSPDETDPDKIAEHLIEMANRELDEARADAFYEVEDDLYAAIEEQFRRATAPEGSDRGTGSEGSTPVSGDATEERGRRPDGPQGAGTDREDRRLDLGEAVDPAIAERQRQETQLRADAPMRGQNRTGQAQDGTMGMGLFDAADQPGLKLSATEPRQFVAPEVVESEANAPNADVVDRLQARLAELKLDDKVRLVVTDLIAGEPRIAGSYYDRVITLALEVKRDAEMTLNHEAVHALREFGLFRDAEWAALSRAAAVDRKLMASVERRYPDLSRDEQIEEVIADRFMAWSRGQSERGFIARAFARVAEFMRTVGQVLRGEGLATPEAVMRAMGRGEIGGREIQQSASDPRYSILEDAGGADFTPAPEARERTATLLSSLNGPNLGTIRDRIDDWRIVLQDKMLPVLRTQEAAAEALGREVAESENPYLAEELMTGRVGAQLEQLTETHIDPLFQAMHDEGVSLDELETFLYARHAQERNAQIARINPEFRAGEGSGMTDTQAKAILARIERSGKRPVLDALAAYVDGINQQALETRVEAGLLSEDEANAWRSTYEHYVPLRGRAEVDAAGPAASIRSQSGQSVRGKEGKRAFGRRSEADNILGYTILQAEEAIVRAEKNRVAQAFVRLAEASPDPNFWQVDKVERRPVMDSTSGLVRYENQSRLSAEDAPYTVTAKINGAETRVTMDRRNPTAVKVAEAMRNLEDPKFNRAMQIAAGFNRYFSAINTRYNPAFVITNAVRDLQTMAVIGQQFDIPGFARKVVRDYASAMTASKRGDGEWSKWRREWELAGGKVYYNDMRDVNSIRRELETKAKRLDTPNAAAKAWRQVFATIEAVNDSVERAVRLSVYKNAREAGKSKAQAASMARNITVNFTRKGRLGPAMNAFYAFFNASTQGSANLIMAAAKSKNVRRAMAGFIVAGFLSDLMNSMISGDDDDGESFWDKMPEHEKSRNVVFMLPGGEKGKAAKIPLAYGLNALFGMGRNLSAMMRGAMTPGKAAMGSAMEFVDAFNPVGSGGSWLNVVAPTVLDPAVDVTENKDFAGKPIQPEQNPFEPDVTPSSNYFPSVSGLAKSAAQALNKATGGDEVVPGAVSVSPEVLEYVTGYLGGGAGRFVMDLGKLVTSPNDPEAEMTIRNVPIAKSLVTEKAPWVDKSRYYERVQRVEQVNDRAKDYADRGDEEALSRYREEQAKVGQMTGITREAQKVMRQVRKERNTASFAHELGRIDDTTYRERLARAKEVEDRVITTYNTRWNAEVGKQ